MRSSRSLARDYARHRCTVLFVVLLLALAFHWRPLVYAMAFPSEERGSARRVTSARAM